MDAINRINTPALILLNRSRKQLTPQQFKTLRGQVLAGDVEGAARGLERLKERRWRHDLTTRQDSGHSNRQQPKN